MPSIDLSEEGNFKRPSWHKLCEYTIPFSIQNWASAMPLVPNLLSPVRLEDFSCNYIFCHQYKARAKLLLFQITSPLLSYAKQANSKTSLFQNVLILRLILEKCILEIPVFGIYGATLILGLCMRLLTYHLLLFFHFYCKI